jgi:twitching motility protein PilI
MANREALRDLQARLAQRLQAARGQPLSDTWLAAECSGHALLFPLAHVGQIVTEAAVQRVPYTQPWCAGVANLRGGLYCMVDLVDFLVAQGDLPEPTTVRRGGEPAWLTLSALLEVNAAMRIDKLLGLRNAQAWTASEPAPGTESTYLGRRYCDADGRWWQELHVQALSQHPAFQAIG